MDITLLIQVLFSYLIQVNYYIKSNNQAHSVLKDQFKPTRKT